ncbi:MAG TPA: radical SAM family heme chaperone HemW [Terriglobales bacterium]|nr:radical SAM family heme chaperone HemW [Terriglobales bacterium]
MPLGLYVSVPFCRTKCTYCNFASDVFSRALFEHYVDRVCADIHSTPQIAEQMGGLVDHEVDSVYLGGGTPTILDSRQLERLFVTVGQHFHLLPETEITVECAPGTLTPPVLETLLKCGVNRVSLGVQSFVDQEAASVGRLHKRSTVLEDVRRLRSAGIRNINIDLIAGLPHQTAQSWQTSLLETLGTEAPHLSVYMLEVDGDSRLGRELIAGGTKYHAHCVPDEELTTELYGSACQQLEAAGVRQYEISNFAREGFESRHNLKYWTRQPYLGFGVDAHSMLRSSAGGVEAVRFSTSDSFDQYAAGAPLNRTKVSTQSALEECFFLGLRLAQGVDLAELAAIFGEPVLAQHSAAIREFVQDGWLERAGDLIRLTRRGRLLSNEVFERFVADPSSARAERTKST